MDNGIIHIKQIVVVSRVYLLGRMLKKNSWRFDKLLFHMIASHSYRLNKRLDTTDDDDVVDVFNV